MDHTDQFAPKTITLDWEANEGALYYTLSIATNKDFKNAMRYVTFDSEMSFNDLFTNKHYYYRVDAKYENKTVRSRIFEFYTTDTPRTISIDGVSNTRDAGGMLTSDGKQIRQGMIYRTAYFDEITEQGKQEAREKYRIKTDLDLRKSGEGATGTSKLGEDIRYYQYSFPYYLGDTGLGNQKNWPNVASAMRVFADESNYPIAFHCSLGRDRTGMVAMLLQGLLGADKTDMFRDYEASRFSVRGTLDAATISDLNKNYSETYSYISNNFDGYTFAEDCELYLLAVGLTQEEIDSIRNILLEEVDA
jgi:protein-tyrosine phosphatase